MRTGALLLLALLVAQCSSGQTLATVERQGNGTLTWTNALTSAQYRVEWAVSPEGPWYYSWESLDNIESGTNCFLTASIPIIYRVVMLPESERLTISANPTTILDHDGDLTVLTVSGGTPPYSWTVCDPYVGSVSPSTGYSVLYQRLYGMDNAVTVQDSAGDYAIIVIQDH